MGFDWENFSHPTVVLLIREWHLKKGFEQLWNNMTGDEQEEIMNSMARIINNLDLSHQV